MKFYNDSPQSLGGNARDAKLSGKKKSEIASEGGVARKESLSAAQRSEIAAQGGKAKAGR